MGTSNFKIDVSERAADLLALRFRDGKRTRAGLKKGQIIKEAIDEGFSAVMALEKTENVWDFPNPGAKTVQFMPAEQDATLNRVYECAAHHNFKTDHHAARACLYTALGIRLKNDT